ncbi:MAG TPA: response regulator transcription factor [Thermodesulfovibrionales bacterium]|nr:response regulator transcription factor [Thermodesulfovibrionales bacterium]
MAIRVFLADDHAIVRDGLRLILESQGDITVVGEASNGRQAVNEVKKTCPDIVIMDIAMPELNGIDATFHITETCPSTHVIILSVLDTSEYIFEALKAGAKGYILKESAGEEVVKAIRLVESGHHYLSQEISETVVTDYIKQRGSGEQKSQFKNLSKREREILQLIVEGKSHTEVAHTLFISPKTVDTYKSRIMQKLDIKDLPSLVRYAIKHGLSPL